MSAHSPPCNKDSACEDCAEDRLPAATHTETMDLAGHRVKVHVLDDGRRIIDSDDFGVLMAWLTERAA